MSWQAKTYGGYANTDQEAHDNAIMIYHTLEGLGYSYNPICAILGNIGWESGYNPWRWQSDYIVSTTETNFINNQTGHAYGLFQFDPAGQYINNPIAMDYADYWPNFADRPGIREDGNAQILYMNNLSNGYIPTANYPETFAQFKVSTQPVSYLAHAWCANYERGTWNNTRETNALYWETELQNLILQVPIWLLFKFRRFFNA